MVETQQQVAVVCEIILANPPNSSMTVTGMVKYSETYHKWEPVGRRKVKYVSDFKSRETSRFGRNRFRLLDRDRIEVNAQNFCLITKTEAITQPPDPTANLKNLPSLNESGKTWIELNGIR